MNITEKRNFAVLTRRHIDMRHDSALKICFSFIISLIIFFLFVPSALAQTLSLSIWPPILEVTLRPGKSITQVYRVKNTGDDTVLTAQIVPFEPAGETGEVKLSSTPNPALSYFSLQNADLKLNQPFEVKSGASQELVLKITVPQSAPITDQYFTLLINSDTKYLLAASGAKAAGSIGANILLTVTTTEVLNQTAKIEEFGLQGVSLKVPIKDSFDSFDFIVRVKNTSDHYLKAIGQLTITNTFGRQIANLPLRNDNILAQSIRQLITENTWQPVFPLGRYTATVSITPQNSTNTTSQSLTFYVLPYKAFLALILVAGFYYLLKSRKALL